MLRWSRRLAWIAVAVLLLVGVFALLTRDDPRIASDDSLTVYTGFDSSVEPLLNDDLGDEDAEVCDVQGGEAVGLTVGHHPAVEEISVTAAFDLDPGRYSVGYTVCLGDERDSAEVLVTVRETPALRVRAVRPGVYKVVNPGDVTVRFRYGETNDEAPRDGSFKVVPVGRRGSPSSDATSSGTPSSGTDARTSPSRARSTTSSCRRASIR